MNRMDTGALDEGADQQKVARGEEGRQRTRFFPRRVRRFVLLAHGVAEGVLGCRRDKWGKGERRWGDSPGLTRWPPPRPGAVECLPSGRHPSQPGA